MCILASTSIIPQGLLSGRARGRLVKRLDGRTCRRLLRLRKEHTHATSVIDACGVSQCRIAKRSLLEGATDTDKHLQRAGGGTRRHPVAQSGGGSAGRLEGSWGKRHGRLRL